MPLEWIKITCDLPEKWQVLTIRRRLKVRTAYEVVGMLVKLWAHFENQTANGKLPGLVAADVDRLVGKKGFAVALVEVGWLKLPEAGGVEIPAFEEYMGAASRAREAEAERKRRLRDRDNQQDTTGTGPGHSPETDRDNAGTTPGQKADTTGTRPGQVRDETGTLEKEIEKDLKESSGASAPTPAPAKTRKTKAAPKERDRNPLFDALAEATGSDPVVSGSHIGKLAALLGRATPPYTPDEVRAFARRYRELCSYAADLNRERPTLGEVEKNIGLLRATKPKLYADPVSQPPPDFDTQPPRTEVA